MSEIREMDGWWWIEFEEQQIVVLVDRSRIALTGTMMELTLDEFAKAQGKLIRRIQTPDEMKRIEGLLKRTQWIDFGEEVSCASCGNLREEGHAESCNHLLAINSLTPAAPKTEKPK